LLLASCSAQPNAELLLKDNMQGMDLPPISISAWFSHVISAYYTLLNVSIGQFMCTPYCGHIRISGGGLLYLLFLMARMWKNF